MNLFSDTIDSSKNILPEDGTVHYYGKLIEQEDSNHYFKILLSTIKWRHDEAIIMGKRIETKRMVAWYGDDQFEYTYSNVTKSALPWTAELLTLKKIVEERTGEEFNSCLLNLYHSGEEGMAWHSDAERDLKKNGTIASVSLGAERKFSFKHKRNTHVVSVILEHGSLLVMKDDTQTNWLHRLPPTKKVLTPRVNLTFRTIVRK